MLKKILLALFLISAVLIVVVIVNRPSSTTEHHVKGYTTCDDGGFIPDSLLSPGVNPGGPCLGSPTYGTLVIPRPSILNKKTINLGIVCVLSAIAYLFLVQTSTTPEKETKP
jgi:preprotein translocase subunit SecG